MGFVERVLSILGESVRQAAAATQAEVQRRFEAQVRMVQRRVMIGMTAIGLLLLAVAFLSVAVMFFFMEFIGLPVTVSALIVGVVLLIVGFIVRLM